MPPDLREWLPEGHLAWFVLDTVEQIDLSAVYSSYRADGSGRPAHDPRMMVSLLVYAYAVGERSSRQIERRCVEDVPFRVLAANRAPDHTTIARFRARHDEALAGLFTSVLELCGRAGMVRVGMVAVDGTKLAANAGLAANRRVEKIREEVDRILAEAAEVDAAEDAEFGQARGDELPAELAERTSRLARLRRAKEQLEAEKNAREEAQQAKLVAREEHRERTGRYPLGRPPKSGPRVRDAHLEVARRNITDPDSRIMTARGSLIQGYNAQAVVTDGQVIVAARVTGDPTDNRQLAPMIDAARKTLKDAGVNESIKCVLADGGYWNHEQITEIRETANRTTVVIPTADPHNKDRRRGPKKGPEADRINRMLTTAAGQRLYRRRAAIVEPVFAHTKHIRGIDRFSRRGLQATDREWQLIAATHNLLKLFRYEPRTA